jgi:hypothetical protein
VKRLKTTEKEEITTPPARLTEELSELLTRLVKQIPYEYRRQAMGDVVQTLLDGKSRKAEDALGWNRHTVKLGLNEFRTGIRCLSDVSARGKKKVEVDNPQLLNDIECILEPHSESDSHLRTTLLHSNVTAKSVRDALIEHGYSKDDLPAERTFYELLNRQGYRRRTVTKSKVQKKHHD